MRVVSASSPLAIRPVAQIARSSGTAATRRSQTLGLARRTISSRHARFADDPLNRAFTGASNGTSPNAKLSLPRGHGRDFRPESTAHC
jgi:hypothetical protein